MNIFIIRTKMLVKLKGSDQKVFIKPCLIQVGQLTAGRFEICENYYKCSNKKITFWITPYKKVFRRKFL